MKRRELLTGMTGLMVSSALPGVADCPCDSTPEELPTPEGAKAFHGLGSKVRVTNMKVFGVTISKTSDRPYVFVKLETNAGVEGWGEATLEGKAAAAMACVNDFKAFVIGSDPMQVEHHWQSMYIHSFYRAGPVMISAISGIDQAMWDIRGKILGLPVYKLLGGPNDEKGVRGYYHLRAGTREELRQRREQARQHGVTAFKTGLPGYFEWLEGHEKISKSVKWFEMIRQGLSPDIDIGLDFHAKTSPTVAAIIMKEIEPLKMLFVEEPCPPENIRAMAKIARKTTTPIATGERLVTPYACRKVVEEGIADILQTDINHVGGVTGLWKVAALAESADMSMAPHNCEGPVGGLAALHVDAAIPNFLIQEVCQPIESDNAVAKIWEEWLGFPAMRMKKGRFPLPEKPGLGFELSEQAFKKYPFKGTRPMARVFHQDGSVAAW